MNEAKPKTAPPPRPQPVLTTQRLRMRLFFVFLGFVFFFSLVVMRLAQLQIWPDPEIEAIARRQFQKVGKKAPFRLPILDRNGEELAVSIPASSVFARPKLVRRKKETSRILAKYLGGPASRWLSRLQSNKPFIWVNRQVSEEVAKKIDRLGLSGIFVEPENRRIYPNENLASNVLGFTDIDGNGLSGLELSLNEELLQRESSFQVLRDGRGTPSYIDGKYKSAEGGDVAGIQVTLDRRLQHALEEELVEAAEKTQAKSVMAVVMDPFTGEVFALGQRPSFDPNHAKEAHDSLFANRMVSYLYEPGSTVKTLFAAEAIEQGLMNRKTPIDCNGGQLQVADRTIREADAEHRFGMLPLEKVIRFSSNVGAVKVAQSLGAARVRGVLDRYGLTSKIGVTLPGEASAALKDDFLNNPVHLATTGFGQGFAVNPLQMIASYAPFANGGFLVRPKILLREASGQKVDGKWDIKRVISPKTAEQMKQVLISVTEEKGGTGVSAAVPGIRVAGKTGTAQKYDSSGGYDKGKYLASFIGFLPADRPELLVGVMVDEPKNEFYAAQVATPLFRRVAERSLQILDRTPKKSLVKADLAEVKAAPPTPTAKPEPVASVDGKVIMPDLKGMSVREAVQVMGKISGTLKLLGSGYLESQEPKAGEPITSKSTIILNFAPPAG